MSDISLKSIRELTKKLQINRFPMMEVKDTEEAKQMTNQDCFGHVWNAGDKFYRIEKIVIEMDMPLMADQITLKELRSIRKKLEQHEKCKVQIVFVCDAEQISYAEKLPGYVPLDKLDSCSRVYYPSNQVGMCESFRFKNKVTANETQKSIC